MLRELRFITALLVGAMCLVVGGEDLARTIMDFVNGEYAWMILDAFLSITLFTFGFFDLKRACEIWREE